MACEVCANNGRCRGGGNLRCFRRNPRASRLAGIVDTYGGIRFVVTHNSLLKNHVGHNELLFVVPKLRVHEPIAWGDIPIVIARIEYETRKQIEEMPTPNEPWKLEAITMYKLRCLEHTPRSHDLSEIAQT